MQAMVEIAATNDQVCALQRIPANVYFGPFIRCPINLLKNILSVRLAPTMLQEEGEDVRPEKDPQRWMNAIIPARCMTEQNVEMLRVPDGGIELRSTREIGAREELRVWCSSSLGQELGIYKVRDDDKEGSQWLCQRCGAKFPFPNLLSAHVTFACNRNDVIKESADDVDLQTERQRMITGGEGERHRKPIESYREEEGDAMLVETRRETRQRSDSPSGVRHIARPSAREFSFYGAYGLPTMLAHRNQRLMNNPKIARLISSFARPRLPKLRNEPKSLAEHQKKEFRKKFQGNERYLSRHLYRDGGCDDADDLDKFEEMLKMASSADEEGAGSQQLKDEKEELVHNEKTRGKTVDRDSNAKYGPFYSSEDFRLALHRKANASEEVRVGSSRILRPFCSIFNANHGVCRSEFPAGNDHVILRGGAHGMAGKCTCGNHNNTTLPGHKEALGEARGTGDKIMNLSKRENGDESPGTNVSATAVDSNKNAANQCVSSMPSFHGNRYVRLNAVLTTPPSPLPYKQPAFNHYYINTASRFSFQHPEPALYLDPRYRYSSYPRMLPGTPTQSSAQAQARAQGFRCEYCGKAYCRKYVLKIHMRTHTGFKPLQCKVCDKTFSDPSNMKKHVKLHETEDTAHRCPQCGRNFVRYRGLLNHLKSKHA